MYLTTFLSGEEATGGSEFMAGVVACGGSPGLLTIKIEPTF
jgi:hypothetical protein